MVAGIADLSDRFRVSHSLELHEEPTSAFFFARVLGGEFAELRQDAWPTSGRSLEPLEPSLLHSSGQTGESVVADRNGALVLAGLQGGYLHARVAAADASAADAVLAALREAFPAPEAVARHDVPVAFWTYTPHGPMPSPRLIAVPGWDEIRGNYAAETRGRLDAIMRDSGPRTAGSSFSAMAKRARAKRTPFAPSPGNGASGASSTTSWIRTRSSASVRTT